MINAPGIFRLLVLFAFSISSAQAIEVTDLSKTLFQVISQKDNRLVVEGDVAGISVGDELNHGKVLLIEGRMIVLEYTDGTQFRPGDKVQLVHDKRRVADRLIEKTLIPVARPSPVPVAARSPAPVNLLSPTTPVSSVSGSDLRSLAYVPGAGRFYLHGTFQGEPTHELDFKTSSGVSFLKTESNILESSLLVAYGVTENLSIGLRESVLIRNQTESTTSTVKTVREGLSDPEFGFLYRMYDDPTTGARGALTFLTSIPVQKNRPATTSEKGNNGAGGVVAGLATSFAWIRGPHEWGPSLAIHYAASQKVETTPETKFDSRFVVSLGLDYRFHANDFFFFSPGVTLVFPSTEKETQDTDITTIEHPLVLVPQIELGVSLSKSILLTAFASIRDFTADGSIQSGSVVGHGSVSMKQLVAGAGLELEF